MARTSSGLEENVAGLLCYVVGWITGVVFLIIERENRFVRFHAIQSIIVFGVFSFAAGLLFWIPIIGWILAIVLPIIWFILWILLMVRAYQGTMYKVPLAGNLAEKWAG